MLPDERSEHLQLCRELYGQFRRILTHRGQEGASTLPINLPMFLRNFEIYIKWAEKNSKVIDIAVRQPPVRIAPRGDIA